MQKILTSRVASVATVAFGTIIYSFGQWLILILLTRKATQADVGLFSLALAISAPISLLLGLSLRTVFLTDMSKYRKFGDYLLIRIIGSILTVIGCLVYGAISDVSNLIFVAVVICKALDLVTDLLCAPLQEQGELWRIGLQTSLNGMFSPATVALCLYFFNTSAEIAVLSTTVGSLVALFSVMYKNDALQGLLTTSNNLPSIVRTAWPLGLSAMVVSLLPNIPRYALNEFVSIESVGVFSAVSYLTIIGTAVVGALAQLLLPRLVRTYQDQGKPALHRQVLKLVSLMTVFGITTVIISFFVGRPILTILYGSEYNQPVAFGILTAAWAVGATSWMYDLGLSTKRMFREQLASSIIAVIVVAGASLYFVPNLLILGAAYATLIGAASQLCARAALFHVHN